MIKYFFRKYQKELIKLANLKKGRKFLNLEKKIPADKKIVGLTPNTVIYQKDRNKFVYLCHIGDVFVRYLSGCITKSDIAGLGEYKGLLHYSGLFKQPRLFPQIFLTDYYAGAGDGWVGARNATYSTARDATVGTGGDDTADYTSATLSVENGKAAVNYIIRRSFFPTDTSAVSGVILSVTTYFYVSSVDSSEDQTLHIVATTQASTSTVVDEDYDEIGAVSWGESATLSALSTVAYTTVTWNATGIAAINQSGVTKWGLRADGDLDNTTPTARGYGTIYTSEQTGTSNDPYLAIIMTAFMKPNKYW